jgi:hypothetical protein
MPGRFFYGLFSLGSKMPITISLLSSSIIFMTPSSISLFSAISNHLLLKQIQE